MTLRRTSVFAALALVASGLAVTAAGGSSVAAPGSTWCADDAPPCIESVTRNGVAVLESDPNWGAKITYPWTDLGGYQEFGWEAVAEGPTPHALSDVWRIVLKTGAVRPETLKARAGMPSAQSYLGGDGQWRMATTARPVLWVRGCTDTAPWPWPCPTTATSENVVLDGDVHTHPGAEFNWLDGFVFSASAIYNGIFLEENADGTRSLVTEMVAPHFRTDGSTPFVGQARFRIPYRTLVEMGIPDPATLVPGSLSGTVNGSSTAGTFTVFHDPAGGGLVIDVTGITFSLKRIKLRGGVITPTRPKITKTMRVAPGRGKVIFTKATPRGARVTGYSARCASGKHVVLAQGSYPRVVVKGLKPGRAYDCKVRAKSKAGPGRWSAAKRLRR